MQGLNILTELFFQTQRDWKEEISTQVGKQQKLLCRGVNIVRNDSTFKQNLNGQLCNLSRQEVGAITESTEIAIFSTKKERIWGHWFSGTHHNRWCQTYQKIPI